jgi:hypothetical protein
MIKNREEVLIAFDRLLRRAVEGGAPADGYVVESVDSTEGARLLGCSGSGEFALLVISTRSRPPQAPLRLAGLAADFGVNCMLNDGGSEREVRVSALRCTTTDKSVSDLFATVCVAVAAALSARPTEKDFADEIGRWSSLFWRLSQKVDTDVVGLAGELVVMSGSRVGDRWVEAWHVDPNELVDFDFPGCPLSVEVKATRGRTRQHPLSLAQAAALGHGQFFASLHVEISDSGESVGDVVRDISDGLNSNGARLALWSVITRTCGEALDEILSRRFEVNKARASLRFYRADSVPAPTVELPLPKGVSRIKYTADFNEAIEVSRDEVEALVSRGFSVLR